MVIVVRDDDAVGGADDALLVCEVAEGVRVREGVSRLPLARGGTGGRPGRGPYRN